MFVIYFRNASVFIILLGLSDSFCCLLSCEQHPRLWLLLLLST